MIIRRISRIPFLSIILLIAIIPHIFSEDLYPIKVGKDKYGYINAEGKLAIEAKFTRAYTFENGIAPVEENNKWSCINEKGETLFTLDVDHISPFSQGLAIVSIKQKGSPYSKKGYIDNKGNYIISPQFLSADDFQENMAVVSNDMKNYFFIDLKGVNVFNMYFDQCYGFKENYSLVRIKKEKNTVFMLLHKSGTLSNLPEGFSFNGDSLWEGYLSVMKGNQYFFWNLSTNEIFMVEEGYEARPCIVNGCYSVTDGKTELEGVRNIRGDWILPCKYESVVPLEDGLFLYKENGYDGFLDENGKVFIEAQFIGLNHFKNDLASFNTRNGMDGGYVSKKGEIFLGRDYLE